VARSLKLCGTNLKLYDIVQVGGSGTTFIRAALRLVQAKPRPL